MKGMLLTLATTVALLVGGLVATPTADARPVRVWTNGYAYRPYYYYGPRPLVYGAPRYYYYSYPGYYYRGPAVYVGPRAGYYYRYW